MKQLGLAGWSGSGKTTLICDLIKSLRARGISASTLKHAHHDFDVDKPGKDSFNHRQAGACEVMIASEKRWALMHEYQAREERASLEGLAGKMTPVDLLLVEGFKKSLFDKIEIHRPSLEKPLLAPEDSHIIAVASDVPLDNMPQNLPPDLPFLNLNAPEEIADFIISYYCFNQSPAPEHGSPQ